MCCEICEKSMGRICANRRLLTCEKGAIPIKCVLCYAKHVAQYLLLVNEGGWRWQDRVQFQEDQSFTCADEMSRMFYETETGQLRCHDPCCVTAQCGQCNKEENRRKNAKKAEAKRLRDKEAAEIKQREEQELLDKTKSEMANGKTYTWTWDRVDAIEGMAVESETVIQSMQKQLESTEAEDEEEKPWAPAAPIKKQKTSDRATTTWNHMTRCMFLKAVAKFNPFGAAVKKDMWAKVSDEMQKSTAILKDTAHGDFCVYTDGHGLQVFYERRRDDMDKKVKKEGATSGHGGFTRSKEDIEEHNLMQTCYNLEKDAIAYRDSKRDRNRHIESLKNNDVNDAIIQAAEDDEVVQVRLLKVLQARVRQAKLECKLFEKDPAKKGMKYTYTAQALKDMEDLEHFKPKGASDVPQDSTDTEAKVPRGGSLASAIQELTSKMPSMAGFTNVDPVAFATSFFETKHKFAETKTLTLQQKLAEINKQFELKVITIDEKEAYTKQVKDNHFMHLGMGL